MNGFYRPSQSQRGFGRTLFLQKAESAHRSVGLLQGRDFRRDGGGFAAAECYLLRRRGKPRGQLPVAGQKRVSVPRALQIVLCLVDGDAPQPLARIVGGDGIPVQIGGKKGFLRQILGRVGAAHQLKADGVNQTLIPGDQPGKLFVCHGCHGLLPPPLVSLQVSYDTAGQNSSIICKNSFGSGDFVLQ